MSGAEPLCRRCSADDARGEVQRAECTPALSDPIETRWPVQWGFSRFADHDRCVPRDGGKKVAGGEGGKSRAP
jgi:hypothetical protein